MKAVVLDSVARRWSVSESAPASVFSGLRTEELARPRPGPGEVLVEVAACGVCHTDLHVVKSEVAFPTPCVLGHEISGVVRETGAGVTGVAPGDRVVSSFIMPCGAYRHCVRGHEDICETFFASNRLRGTLYDGRTRLAREAYAALDRGEIVGRAVIEIGQVT